MGQQRTSRSWSNQDLNNHRADYPTSPVVNVTVDSYEGGFESDLEEEPEREGVDVLDEYYTAWTLARPWIQQLYHSPVLSTVPPPRSSILQRCYRFIRHTAHPHNLFHRRTSLTIDNLPPKRKREREWRGLIQGERKAFFFLALNIKKTPNHRGKKGEAHYSPIFNSRVP